MAWRGIVNKAFTANNVADYLDTLSPPSFVKFIVVHNTGAPTLKQYLGYSQRANPITDQQWLRNLEKYYRDEQGWSAGPHWFVTPNKLGLLAFTPSTVQGTHTPSWNRMSLGIETVGDWNVEKVPQATWDNLVALLAALHSWLGLDPTTLKFHKEDRATTHKDCPGRNLIKADLIAAVQEKMGGQATTAADLPHIPSHTEGESVADSDGGEATGSETITDLISTVAPTAVGPILRKAPTITADGVQRVVRNAAEPLTKSKQTWGGAALAVLLSWFGLDKVDVSFFEKAKAFFTSPGFIVLLMVGIAGLMIYWRWKDHGRGALKT